MGYLVMTCDQALYIKLVDSLLADLRDNCAQAGSAGSSGDQTLNASTLIQAVTAICRQAGHRFGDHVEPFVALIMRYVETENDDLREQVMHACELHSCALLCAEKMCVSFRFFFAVENMVYKCGKEITPHLERIVAISLRYICYDPNYNYGDEGEDGDDDMDTEEDEDENGAADSDEDDDEYSDDDDMSWKVRRAGAKCLEAVISTRHELLKEVI